MKTRYSTLIILLGLLMFWNTPAGAQDTKKLNYGRTPDEIIPYGRFQEAYKWFFADPQPFLGPGREKKAPAGLKTVRVGFLGPLEGSMIQDLGEHMLNGTTLAIEEANAKGGYHGIPFELMVHNDVGMWGAAANEVVKLDEEKVWGFLGSIDGIVTHVALRVALKLEIPMINTGDPDPTLTETRIPWMIRTVGDDRQHSYALALKIFKEMGLSRVAVLRTNYRYGRVGIMEFREAARRLGYPLVLEVRYDEGETDFTTQLERVRNSRPDAIVLWGNAKETGLIVKQIRAMGMEQPIFGGDRLVSDKFLEIAGEDAEGVIATYPYNPDSDNPRLVAFTKKYEARFGSKPDSFAAHAYDGMNILLDAIQIAGLNRAKIRDVLTDLKTFQGYEGVTGTVIFDASWNDIGSVYMAEVKNGKFVFYLSPMDAKDLTGSIKNKENKN